MPQQSLDLFANEEDSPRFLKIKESSATSSIIMRRFKTPDPTNEPFVSFCKQADDHRGVLVDVGAWSEAMDSEVTLSHSHHECDLLVGHTQGQYAQVVLHCSSSVRPEECRTICAHQEEQDDKGGTESLEYNVNGKEYQELD